MANLEKNLKKCQYWLKAHQLAMAAWNLKHRYHRKKPLSPAEAGQIMSYMNSKLDVPQTEINHLPLYVFDYISSLKDTDFQSAMGNSEHTYVAVKSNIATARTTLTQQRKQAHKPSVFRAANIIAERFLSPTANARSIAGLGSEIFDISWKKSWSDKKLRKMINAVTATQLVEASTNDKIQAIAALSQYLYRQGSPLLSWWPQVEFILLNQLFTWPLCALNHGDRRGNLGMGYPFALDVKLGHRSQVKIVGHDNVKFGDGVENSLERALEAAKKLWRSQNGNASQTLKHQIQNASITLDARPAGSFLEELGPRCAADIGGRSLEAYFAIAILGRFSGIDRAPAMAISGVIGDIIERNGVEQLDYEVQAVEGIPEKYSWAVASRMFNTVILPEVVLQNQGDLASIKNTQKKGDKAFVQTRFVANMKTAADVAFGTRWRRYRAVRANDFLHAILKPEPLGLHKRGLQRAQNFLASNQNTVAELPPDVSTEDLIGALYSLNEVWQPNQPDGQQPPKRSVIFFRLDHNEPRARMLISLFSLLGVHPNFLHKILNASTHEEATQLVAVALNQAENSRRRAPDIIVFIKPSGTIPNTRSPIPFDEELEFDKLFSPHGMLSKYLRGTADERWEAKIARTRIVIVPDDKLGGRLNSGGEPGRKNIKLFQSLSTMRYGFTGSMVSKILSDDLLNKISQNPGDIRSWLKNSVQAGQNQTIAGRYYLSPNAKRKVAGQNSRDIVSEAEIHRKAALAYAPYLRLPGEHGNRVRILENEAHDPEMMHEAQFHIAALDELEALIKQKYRKGFKKWRQAMRGFQKVRHMYASQLGCFYEKENWDLIRYAVANPRFHEAYLAYVVQIALVLIEEANISRLPVIRITAVLGIFDKYVLHLQNTGRVEDARMFRVENKETIQKLASTCKKQIGTIEKRARKGGGLSDTHQAVFATAHLTSLALRKDGLGFRLSTWSHESIVAKMCIGIKDRLLKNDQLPEGGKDNQLGYCPPPEWFARYVGRFDPLEYATASTLYRIGRQHRRGRLQRSAQLFVNAIGILENGSESEKKIFDELNTIGYENEYKLKTLLKYVKSIGIDGEESLHWKQGYDRFVAWADARVLGSSVSLEDVFPEDGDDEEDSDFHVGAWSLDEAV